MTDYYSANYQRATFFRVRLSYISATKELGEPNHAGFSIGASVWFKWTAPQNSHYSFATRMDGDNMTTLAVYKGSDIGNLTEVASYMS